METSSEMNADEFQELLDKFEDPIFVMNACGTVWLIESTECEEIEAVDGATFPEGEQVLNYTEIVEGDMTHEHVEDDVVEQEGESTTSPDEDQETNCLEAVEDATVDDCVDDAVVEVESVSNPVHEGEEEEMIQCADGDFCSVEDHAVQYDDCEDSEALMDWEY